MTVLRTTFCGIAFENPLVLASGVLGVTGKGMADVIAKGAGGVTSKSWWVRRHAGHPNPVIIADEYAMLNAVGLPDAGIEKSREEIREFRKVSDAPFIANIVAGSVEDFEEITQKAVELKPDILEVNISCPNVKDEFGDLFSGSCDFAEKMTRAVKKHAKNIPVSVKLSPNVANIADVARACEANGADAITAINTVGPGMRINPELRKPILSNKTGGVSGPAIFPSLFAVCGISTKPYAFPLLPQEALPPEEMPLKCSLREERFWEWEPLFTFAERRRFPILRAKWRNFAKKKG